MAKNKEADMGNLKEALVLTSSLASNCAIVIRNKQTVVILFIYSFIRNKIGITTKILLV